MKAKSKQLLVGNHDFSSLTPENEMKSRATCWLACVLEDPSLISHNSVVVLEDGPSPTMAKPMQPWSSAEYDVSLVR
jgi:hypothetical protein